MVCADKNSMIRIGKDRVLRKGDALIVYSPADMYDWNATVFRRNAIVFEEIVWCVKEKRGVSRKLFRYHLEKRTEGLSDIPGRTIVYDAHYVADRDAFARTERIRHAQACFLRLLMPLIGLLPSKMKLRIEKNYLISAKSATVASICLELFLFFGAGFFNVIAVLVSLHPKSEGLFIGDAMLLTLTTLVLVIDMWVRYGRHLREEDRSPFGFYEWVFRRRKLPY
jgi:hypothetical protein